MSRQLQAFIDVNSMFMAEQREINAAIMNTFLSIAMGSRQVGELNIVSMPELAQRLNLGKTTVSRHVRYLGDGIRRGDKGLGLVESFRSPGDDRMKMVHLTVKGEDFLRRLLEVGTGKG